MASAVAVGAGCTAGSGAGWRSGDRRHVAHRAKESRRRRRTLGVLGGRSTTLRARLLARAMPVGQPVRVRAC